MNLILGAVVVLGIGVAIYASMTMWKTSKKNSKKGRR